MLNKLDAPRIMVGRQLACALVVSSNRRLNFSLGHTKTCQSRCKTHAAHDERACHNGWYHKMQRIELVKCEVDLKR